MGELESDWSENEMHLGVHTIKKHFIVIIFLLLISGSFLSCSSIDETNNELKDVVKPFIKVDDISVYEAEAMIYTYQVSEEFEKIGGKDVWEFEDFSGGKSAVEVARQAVAENIIRIKVLNSNAKELGVVINDKILREVQSQAVDYFTNMDKSFKEEYDIDLPLMIQVFSEARIANMVVNIVTQEYEPSEENIELRMNQNEEYANIKDISPYELLTSINVYHILLTTRKKLEDGGYVPLDKKKKQEKYDLAVQIRNKVLSGESFKKLMLEYSDEIFGDDVENPGYYQFSAAALPKEYESEISTLSPGDITDIIETESGYHLFTMDSIINPTEDELEAFKVNFEDYKVELREGAIQELKNETFNNLYMGWEKEASIEVDEEQVNSLIFN